VVKCLGSVGAPRGDAVRTAMKYLQLLDGAPKLVHQTVEPSGKVTTITGSRLTC
jgi:hypothetical protein